MRPRLATALALLLCGACGRGSTSQSYDLAALLPTADVWSDTTSIDFGTPQADDYMLDGWSPNPETAKQSFTWGIREGSSVRWFAAEPRAVTLRFRCEPLPAEFGRGPETMAVENNGHPVETVMLRPEMVEYAVALPADSVRAGWNRLTFVYGSPDGAWANTVRTQIRPLAVLWDWLRVEGARSSTDSPASGTAGGVPALDLPANVRVDYYFAVAPGSALTLDALTLGRGAAAANGARLAVELEPAGSPARTTVLVPRTISQSIPLPVAENTRVRLSLRVLTDGVAAGEPGLELVQPRVLTPTGVGPHGDPDRAPSCRRAGEGAAADARAPNVILYVIDTLRADHLGVYGYARPTSPNIDRFAAGATVFTNTLASTSWTRASMASVFTGLRPRHHGVNDRQDALPDTAVTLAELLRQGGYATGGFITNGNIVSELGFGQGFDVYNFIGASEECRLHGCAQPAEKAETSSLLKAYGLRWVSAQPSAERPFFLYLHGIDPHEPYIPPESTRERLAPGVDPALGGAEMMTKLVFLTHAPTDEERAGIAQLYDSEIAFGDEGFGALLRDLQRLGLYDQSLIVLLADHGEEFLDHGGWLHGRTLYGEQLRVPLIIKRPGQRAGERIDAPAQLIDVLPTVLSTAGLDLPPNLDGHTLFPVCTDASDASGPRFASLELEGNASESVQLANLKLVRRTAQSSLWWYPPIELFDLAADPGERHDLADERPVDVGYLSTLLSAERRTIRVIPATPAPLPDAVREQLRALGYGT